MSNSPTPRDSDSAALSPWAHPKAQEWFETLFQRTRIHDVLEDFILQASDNSGLAQCRIVLAYLILLGRPGIWPEQHYHILESAAKKFTELTARPDAFKSKTMSMAEHREFNVTIEEMRLEVERLRRRLGMSRLKSRLGKPKSWGRFWD